MALRRSRSVLVVDIGGSNVKTCVSGYKDIRKFESGPKMTPQMMIRQVRKLNEDLRYDVVSLGYPGLVMNGRIAAEPYNLARGWVDFDFKKAFTCPVHVMNDAAMQALGSYEGGRMLFLGLGTGMGSALIIDGVIAPMELAHLPFKSDGTYEDFVGERARKRLGSKKWRRAVKEVIELFRTALEVDYVVVGGGNANKLKKLPSYVRLGDNQFAFSGGFRVWSQP